MSRSPSRRDRHLAKDGDAFLHNAWDDVDWNEEQTQLAEAKIAENGSCRAPAGRAAECRESARNFWNEFYKRHGHQFFKNRHWLFGEFAPLQQYVVGQGAGVGAEAANLLEIGCGVGNTVIPVLQATAGSGLRVFACDFSPVAVELLQKADNFAPDRCDAFVWDIRQPDAPGPMAKRSVDYATLIFVLSALHPDDHEAAVRNVVAYLKPGSLVFFRDYGRCDMAQLRFKKGSCIGDNFYARGDGTQVYFFDEDKVEHLFSSAGMEKVSLYTDRRLQTNRLKLLKMYRIWLQAVYRKPA